MVPNQLGKSREFKNIFLGFDKVRYVARHRKYWEKIGKLIAKITFFLNCVKRASFSKEQAAHAEIREMKATFSKLATMTKHLTGDANNLYRYC